MASSIRLQMIRDVVTLTYLVVAYLLNGSSIDDAQSFSDFDWFGTGSEYLRAIICCVDLDNLVDN